MAEKQDLDALPREELRRLFLGPKPAILISCSGTLMIKRKLIKKRSIYWTATLTYTGNKTLKWTLYVVTTPTCYGSLG
jgi:hypothetical protein